MEFKGIQGVPQFQLQEFHHKNSEYCICIPIINEGERIIKELERAKAAQINTIADIIICDGGSEDGSTERTVLEPLGVNSLLTKIGPGKQGAQLRMGLWWALERGYKGIITIDGNNKDSIEDVTVFIDKLKNGFDFIQGSRFIQGGKAVNTPVVRYLSVRLLHAPIISLSAHHRFTDTTNAFRGYSRYYLTHPGVQPFREIFMTYELLAYLSVRATQLGLKVCEVPVKRVYPLNGKVPTKISFFKGNYNLLRILFLNMLGIYKPKI